MDMLTANTNSLGHGERERVSIKVRRPSHCGTESVVLPILTTFMAEKSQHAITAIVARQNQCIGRPQARWRARSVS
jgi:hypothetical protein